MDKQILLNFLSKYHLGGTVNAVKITSINNEKLKCGFLSDTQAEVGIIEANVSGFGDNVLHVYTTNELVPKIATLKKNIKVKVVSKSSGEAHKLLFTDGELKNEYILSLSSLIPPTPKLDANLDVTVTFTLDKGFIDKFSRAEKANSSCKTFAIKSNGKHAVLIMNYNKENLNNLNKTTFVIGACDVSFEPVCFSTDFFKLVLSCNSDSTNSKLKLCLENENKLAVAEFSNDNFKAEYFLMSNE